MLIDKHELLTSIQYPKFLLIPVRVNNRKITNLDNRKRLKYGAQNHAVLISTGFRESSRLNHSSMFYFLLVSYLMSVGFRFLIRETKCGIKHSITDITFQVP